jgi:hypothetical protein
MGERVLELLLFFSGSVPGVSVSTMLDRCAASGAVGKYKAPRWPQALSNSTKITPVAAKRVGANTWFTILLLCFECVFFIDLNPYT